MSQNAAHFLETWLIPMFSGTSTELIVLHVIYFSFSHFYLSLPEEKSNKNTVTSPQLKIAPFYIVSHFLLKHSRILPPERLLPVIPSKDEIPFQFELKKILQESFGSVGKNTPDVTDEAPQVLWRSIRDHLMHSHFRTFGNAFCVGG